MCAVFAMQIQAIVVGWQVYEITRDPMSLAYVGLAQFIPMVLLLPYAGDIVDRFNRKTVLAISWLVLALSSAMLLWLSYAENVNIYGFYVVLLVLGSGRAFTGPALQSLLPQIMPHDRLAQALATNSMLMKVAAITGPVLGGLLYAYVGGLTYAVCCACMLFAIFLLVFVPILYSKQHEAPATESTNVFQRFSEGIRFIWKNPIILGTITLDLFAVLLGGVVALLPIYAQEVLHVDSTGLGLLRSAMAIGEIGTGLYLSRRPFNRHVGKVMFTAVAVFGIANLVFAFSTTDGEILAAKAAEKFGLPFTLSTMSVCSIEDVAANTTQPFWFQLYVMKDRDFMRRLIGRAKDAGCSALVLTLDLQVMGQRHKDIKNGLSTPPKPTLLNILDLALRPEWCWHMSKTKRRSFGNIVGHVTGVADMTSLASWTAESVRPTTKLERYRLD
ncbi:L-lactate dehydrogenase [Oligella ureolytica]